MANKYEKLLLRGALGKTPHTEAGGFPIISCVNVKQWEGSELSFRMTPIANAHMMEEKQHSHDYNDYMAFLGGDPLNFKEFDAEIELTLGEEREKYIITEPTVVYIPKGLMHCPLNFKRVTKPVLYLHIFPVVDYAKNPAPTNK
jgi:hypothetical protein